MTFLPVLFISYVNEKFFLHPFEYSTYCKLRYLWLLQQTGAHAYVYYFSKSMHSYSMMASPNDTFSALLALCAGKLPVSGEFSAQSPVTRSFDVFFDLHLIKRLSKHSRGWWFETLSRPLWRHCNVCDGRFHWYPAGLLQHDWSLIRLFQFKWPCWIRMHELPVYEK